MTEESLFNFRKKERFCLLQTASGDPGGLLLNTEGFFPEKRWSVSEVENSRQHSFEVKNAWG